MNAMVKSWDTRALCDGEGSVGERQSQLGADACVLRFPCFDSGTRLPCLASPRPRHVHWSGAHIPVCAKRLLGLDADLAYFRFGTRERELLDM